MKQLRLALILIATTACMTAAFGQEQFKGKQGFDIRIGYGIVPVQNMSESFSTDLIPDLADPAYVTLKKKGSGVFSASLMYQTKGRIGFGVDVAYGTTTSEFAYSNTSVTAPESKWFSLMARGNFTYSAQTVNVPNVELYGSLAVGSCFRDANVTDPVTGPASLNDSYLAYQITPIGIRTGQKIAFWAELGYGYKGLLNIGLSAKF